jgi:RNA polymerase sigma factor (sigma-70 family)
MLEQARASSGHGDAALLERFVADNDEVAFEVLVQRHGPMVLGACRRILLDNHDAEDAFQATFLVLARRAGTIRNADALAAWLYAVACQVSTRARKARGQRNRTQILTGTDIGERGADEGPALEWRELRPVLDEELGRLPEKYRAPVVLCYLEERSNAEAAEQLGWPVGTVKGRLARAREMLQSRLARRGVALSVGLLATGSAARAALTSAVPPALMTATLQQAARIALGAAPAAAGATPAVAALYGSAMRGAYLGKVKVFGALIALVALCALSGALLFRSPARPAEGPPAQPAPDARPPVVAGPKEKRPVAGRTEPAGVALSARLVGGSDSYPLDLGGLSGEEFRKKIADLAKAPRRPGPRGVVFPPSPKVGLRLELTNVGAVELQVRVRGNANVLVLDLKGPAAFYAPAVPHGAAPMLQRPEVLILAPGQTITLLDVPELSVTRPGPRTRAYWSEPGTYTLTGSYVLGIRPAPPGARDVGDGFGEVTVYTAPLTLKVVKAK